MTSRHQLTEHLPSQGGQGVDTGSLAPIHAQPRSRLRQVTVSRTGDRAQHLVHLRNAQDLCNFGGVNNTAGVGNGGATAVCLTLGTRRY